MNTIKTWSLTVASLALVLFLLVSCGEKIPSLDANEKDEPDGIVVFRSYTSYASDDIAEGVKDYAVQNKVRFLTVYPSSFETKDIEKEMAKKISDGYTTVVSTGIEYLSVFEDMSEAFPEAHFYLFDAYIFEERDNVTSVFYDSYDAGYISGYIMASAGGRNVGFLGAVPIGEILESRDGFIAGLSHAAGRYNCRVNVTVAFADSFVPKEHSRAVANALYDEGLTCVLGSGPGTWEVLSDACKTRSASFCDIAYVTDSDFCDFAVVFDHKKAAFRLFCDYFGSENVPDTVYLGVTDGVFKLSASDIFTYLCRTTLKDFESGKLTIDHTPYDCDNVEIYEYN